MKRDLVRLLAGILAITGLFSCATQNTPSADSSRESGSAASPRIQEERPGLATGWGNEKQSTLTARSFIRASSKPSGTDVIYYNDLEGNRSDDRQELTGSKACKPPPGTSSNGE